MSAASVRLLTFAQSEPELWGVACEGALGVCTAGTWNAMSLPPQGGDGEWQQDGADGWRLASDAGELHVRPAGETVAHDVTDSTHQLCRVQGTLTLDQRQVQIDASGIRAVCPTPGAVRADALRAVDAHFDAADGLAVTMLRPRKARGHDHDAISAAILQADSAVRVGDPRLSTTYADDGSVLRVGLELWLDSDDDAVSYPRRAAGQVADGSVRLGADGLVAQAYPIRWRSRGQTGLGIYLLARPA